MAASTNAQLAWLMPFVATNTHPPRPICAFAKGQTEMNTVAIQATEDADKAASLSDDAVAEAATIAVQANHLFQAEEGAQKQRAMLFYALSAYILRYDLKAINGYAETLGYSNKSKMTFHLAAQFLTGINVFNGTTDAQRAARQTRLRPFALGLEVLFHRKEEHSHLDEDGWFEWYRANGQQKGLLDWLKAQTARSAKVAELEPTPDSLVDDAFGSAAAVTLSGDLGLPGLIAGRPMLVMLRQDASGIVAVPLPKAGNNALASVAGYRATGLENALPPLRFWHLLMSVGTAIVPDATSDEPVLPLEPDDEPKAATPMLPAFATYLWDDGKFSISAARSHDTRIVELRPRDGIDLGISSKAVRFIDKRTRNTMTERLLQPSVCAGYGGEKGISVTTEGGRVSVKFTHTNKKLNGQLTFPLLAKFGTNWTSRVSPAFEPAADAIMDEAAVAKFSSSFLEMLSSKGKTDAQVSVTISDSKIEFNRDKAKTIGFVAEASGSAAVRVMQSDLLAVIQSLLGLDRVGGLAWELDPAGLLMIKAWTNEAIVCAYVQTLEEGRDTRSRKLLERVRAPISSVPLEADNPALAA
jgi:hypothetical protein